MPGATFVTLVLAGSSPALAEAHDELYPARVLEGIPLSLTLLYPFVPRGSLTDADLETLRSFFAARPPLVFDLVRLDELPGLVVYAVPEPDDELRATMRALWALYPQYPPYGRPGSDPPPHATLSYRFDATCARRRSSRSSSPTAAGSARPSRSALARLRHHPGEIEREWRTEEIGAVPADA